MATHLPTLKYADIFYGLRTEHLERIDAICSELAPEQDTVLFEENSPGGEMYIVARGSVEIQVDPAMLGLDTNTGLVHNLVTDPGSFNGVHSRRNTNDEVIAFCIG